MNEEIEERVAILLEHIPNPTSEQIVTAYAQAKKEVQARKKAGE